MKTEQQLDPSSDLPNESRLVTIDQVNRELDQLEKAPGSIRNIKSALKQMVSQGYLSESLLVQQLGSDFELTRKSIQKAIKKDGKSPQWGSFINDIRWAVNEIATFDVTHLPFSDALKLLAVKRFGKGKGLYALALLMVRAVKEDDEKCATNNLVRWMQGVSYPRTEKSFELLNKVERYLGSDGSLSGRVGKPIYRKTMGVRELLPPVSIPSAVSDELDQLCEYRVKGIPPSPSTLLEEIGDYRAYRIYSDVDSDSWTAKTAKNMKKFFARFYRFVEDAFPEKATSIQLVDMLCPELLTLFVRHEISRGTLSNTSRYLQWLASEAKPNSFFSVALSPCNSVFYKHKPNTYSRWLEDIELTRAEIQRHQKRLNADYEALEGSRNVDFILASENPDELTRLISEAIWAESQMASQSSSRAIITLMTALMFDIELVCPIRASNYAALRIAGSLTTAEAKKLTSTDQCLYYDSQKDCYVVFVGKQMLKNRKSKNITDVRQPLPHLTDKIGEYLSARSAFLESNGVGTDSLNIVTRTTERKGKITSQIGDTQKPDSMANTFKLRTGHVIRTHLGIQDEPGINPHGMRHLAATAFLRDHPENYTGLATLLMDDLNTVLRVYARRDDAGNSEKIANWAANKYK